MKILIVDDETDLANLLRVNLEVESFECVVAGDGGEGLEKAMSEQPDLILLDIKMPVINGFKVLEELKKNKQTFNIPVIMCSTIRGEESINRAYSLGATDYIIKPFETSELIMKINKVFTNNGETKNISY